jgi:2-methylcitrate dehydratase PrpD
MAQNEKTAPRHSDETSRPTRRDILQGAGLAVAAAALPFVREAAAAQLPAPPADVQPVPGEPGRVTRADYPVSAVMTRLSTYISQAHEQPLPAEVQEQAKIHSLDSLAAIVSGSGLPAGRAAMNFIRGYAGGARPMATVVADTTLCGAIEAALVNAVMAHADETDDVLPGAWHPGSNIIPATLAAGEQFGISGERFLRAVTLGYDIGNRVLATVGPGISGTLTLTYAIGGVFGSTAAASCAAGLNAEQVRYALSYSAQQCSGFESFPRDPHHIEKGFIFSGMNARNGITSVLLVHAGFDAVDDIMSGPLNFIDFKNPKASPGLLVDKLGEHYAIMNAALKRWTVGYPIQGVLDATEALLKRHPIDPSQVQEIIVQGAPGSITDNSGPGDINTQYVVALMLVKRAATFKDIHNWEMMKDPEIVRLRALTKLMPGPGGPGLPGSGRGPVLQITLRDGTHIEQNSPGPLLGTATNPMSHKQIVAKCQDLMEPVLGTTKASNLINRVFELEKVTDIRELRPLLQAKYVQTPKLSGYPSA